MAFTIIMQHLLVLILFKIAYSEALPKDVKHQTMIGRLSQRAATEVHSCPNMVYCQGDLLDTVQKHKLFNDSKTFVDMTQINDQNTTLANFNALMASTGNNPTKEQVQTFVDENFVFLLESENWTPTDYNPSPAFLDKIRDSTIRTFAKDLVSLWHLLGRKINDTVRANEERHSIIPVPEPFIVPGGRFREIYYWDSYWIIKGLLISEMTTTVKGMLTNFVYLINKYGLIPNGSRIYYINRSQPPLFAMMVGLYLDHTNDIEWLRSNIEYIETELNFWLTNRTLTITVSGNDYQLAHFGTDSNTPRPESYSEDLETCSHCSDDTERFACYNALKTAAETGWDFSTRWIFDESGGTSTNLSYIDSQRVIPVDLNAFLCKSFRLLSKFYGKLGNTAKETQWAEQANRWQANIEMFLYDENDGIWYDFDYDLLQQRKYFYASNFAPLWTDCYDTSTKVQQGQKAVDYFRREGLDAFQGGIPTSLQESGEQWDLPNAWPPLQEMSILGLYHTENLEAQELAANLASKWINANLLGYQQNGVMYEKYDAKTPGQYGGGGEYAVQIGFGWSNGVVLSLIDQFSSGIMFKASLNQCVYIMVFGLLTYLTNKIQ